MDNIENRDLKRMSVVKKYSDGTIIGTVSSIHNVSNWVWYDFKKLSRLRYGNNEGACFAACVEALKNQGDNLEMLKVLRDNNRNAISKFVEESGENGKECNVEKG